jgi:hypothetical protein
MGSVSWVLSCDQLIDHLGEAVQAEVKPHDLAKQEGIDGIRLINRGVYGFGEANGHICQVVNHNHKCANLLQVAKDKAKVKRNGQYVVQHHFEEV